MKLLLLDGNSLINRAFYGIRMLNAPDGTPTNAVYGFLTILQKLLESEKPDSLCVTFDVHAPTFRHQEYAAYKAGRRPMPEELKTQLPLLKEVLDAMGIPRRELAGWEADDLLGTLSLRAAGRGDECVIVTGDKDALQLVSERVRVLNVKTRLGQTETIDYTPASFEAEYGFAPAGMVDLKALMGDASDNLPGVPGVGEKTALELMHRYGSLAGVYEHIDDAGIRETLRKKLIAGRESAELSYHLAAIRTDAPAEFDFPRWELRPSDALYPLFRRLGFQKFLDKWHIAPPAETVGESVQGECESLAVSTPDELAAAMERLGGGTVSLWCSETLDTLCAERDGFAALLREESYRGDYAAALSQIFDPALPKAGHNVKNLLRAALSRGVEADGFEFDSALAAYLLDATAGSYELERLTMKYCGFTPFTAQETAQQLSLLDDIDAERADDAAILGEYASRAAAVEALREVLEPKLRENGMEELFRDMELPLCKVLAEMEQRGVLVDRAALRRYGEELSAGIEALQAEIWHLAGREFNINSPRQLGTVLFDELGLPGGKKTKTGWSTSADVLDKLRVESPLVQAVLDYRELTKLKSTYAEGLLKVIEPDGRIRTSFMMTVTATGRLSSAEPNLQNIPVRKPLGAELRKMFVAAPGSVLVDADYSQIELRLLSHISGDENMRAAFLSGEDFHAVTASQVFNVPLQEVTPAQRRAAKAVNFGIVYGISAFSLSQDLGVSVYEAKAYMEAYFARFPGVQRYQERVVAEAKERGYVETLFRRRRALPELSAPQFATRAFGERVALNMPIQGTAADVIKLAMLRAAAALREAGLQAQLILQVHDELIVECPESEAETVQALLQREMESAVSYSVPLLAEAHIGHSWAEAH